MAYQSQLLLELEEGAFELVGLLLLKDLLVEIVDDLVLDSRQLFDKDRVVRVDDLVFNENINVIEHGHLQVDELLTREGRWINSL